MHIDWWTLALQTINLLVLVWILSRFLFRPIADIIRQRQSAADQLMEQAAAERVRADAEEKQARRDTEKAEKARGNVLKTAAKEAEVEKAQILAEARQEAERLRAAATEEVEKLREAEKANASRQASELAVDIAAKLFDRLPENAKFDGFIDGLADAVAKLPDRARNEIGAGGQAITVRSARDLSEAELEACKAALSGALGRDVRIIAQTDPTLIAGLEIETPHAVVHNNFRADLERIAAELTGHEQV